MAGTLSRKTALSLCMAFIPTVAAMDIAPAFPFEPFRVTCEDDHLSQQESCVILNRTGKPARAFYVTFASVAPDEPRTVMALLLDDLAPAQAQRLQFSGKKAISVKPLPSPGP
ncbi:hypothetical protein D2T29_12275 [Sinirhodobacter populi]|uniref:Uncharacterized protein n=1 Tax=Paenirhodobacter populi TaxID=2306993 RepID=A0A443KCR8_9RHOB|nr:hypothetical protein [Sinirhodobacter populi]RWR30442.1 hypothetical protein D2T29_12275 [Sinirhodobacter populi]